MASVAFSSSTEVSSAIVQSISLGVLHQDLRSTGSIYTGYYIVCIIHYKEKTTIGHEFLVLYLDNGTKKVVVRIERRPSTRKVASSSVVWTDDSITKLVELDFRPDNHYLISTTTFHHRPLSFSVLDMCSICDTIRKEAPLYSVLRDGRHCYWFCAAFLYRVRSMYYTCFEEGKDYEKRGCFMGIKLISEEYIRRRFTAANSPSYQCILEGDFKNHTDRVGTICFTPDGQRVVSSSMDKTIRIWDASTRREVREPLKGHLDSVFTIAVSPDGRQIVSGSRDKTVRIWDLETGVPITEPLKGHDNIVSSVAFSPDGCKVASGSTDGSVRIWDVQKGAAIGQPLRGHQGPVRSVTWSPDGKRIISGSLDHTIRAWDAETGALRVHAPFRGHLSAIFSVAFSSDGKRILSGSADRTIRIWDSASGLALGEPLYGHTNVVRSAAFSHDERWIISGSHDGTVRIWDNMPGGAHDEVARLDVGVEVYCVAWSPSGDRLAAASIDSKVRVWRSPTITSQVV